MEEEQPKQPNRYIEYIKTHKYSFYFGGAIVIILLFIISIITLIVSQPKSTPTTAQTDNSQTQNTPNVPSLGNIAPTLIITTPNPTEAAVINTQTQPQITPNVAVPYTVSNIIKYGNDWGVMTINNPDVGNGWVIVKKVNNTWTVILGPGTSFTEQDLQSVGAPTALLNILTAQPSPSESPSSSPSFDAQ